MKLTIQATKANLTPEEVKAALTPEQRAKVKGKVLVPYTIAEEGKSQPRVIGEGSKILNWTRAVIKRTHDVLTTGTKLFARHNEDNSTQGREPVGEVVGKIVKDIGGKLRTIAIACMTESAAREYDVCSIEADVTETDSYIDDVERITGIAVSNSRLDQPAFANAKRELVVQCFNSAPGEPESADESGEDHTMAITLDDLMKVDKDTLTKAVKMRDLHPHHMFTLRDIEDDREFSSLITEKNDALKKAEDAKKSLEDMTSKYSDVSKKVTKATATELLKSRMPSDLIDKQKAFIEKSFNPESLGEVTEENVDAFIDNAKEQFKTVASIFGEGDSQEAGSSAESNPSDGDVSLEDAIAED